MWPILTWLWHLMADIPGHPKPVPPPKRDLTAVDARLADLARMRVAAAVEVAQHGDPTDGAADQVMMTRVDMLLDERLRLTR